MNLDQGMLSKKIIRLDFPSGRRSFSFVSVDG
jgi:hypothetical protein